jgi:hypothetical protein
VRRWGWFDNYTYADAYTDTYFYADSGRDLHDCRYRHAGYCALTRDPGHSDCDSGFVGCGLGGQLLVIGRNTRSLHCGLLALGRIVLH